MGQKTGKITSSTEEIEQGGLGSLFDIILSEYNGYTLNSLINEVTLPQLMIMLKVIAKRNKQRMIERICAMRVAYHCGKDEFQNFVASLSETEALLSQANAIQASAMKNIPGFSME